MNDHRLQRDVADALAAGDRRARIREAALSAFDACIRDDPGDRIAATKEAGARYGVPRDAMWVAGRDTGWGVAEGFRVGIEKGLSVVAEADRKKRSAISGATEETT